MAAANVSKDTKLLHAWKSSIVTRLYTVVAGSGGDTQKVSDGISAMFLHVSNDHTLCAHAPLDEQHRTVIRAMGG